MIMATEMFGAERFGEARLDEKDRKILEVLYESGSLNFNALAERVKSEVSRATLVGRLEKLVILGYLQKSEGKTDRRSVIIKLNPSAYILMYTVEETRSRLRTLSTELEKLKPLDAPEDELTPLLDEVSKKLSSAYSMTTSVALLLGVSAATEVFLPMLIDEYRQLAQILTQILARSPNARRSYLNSVFTQENLDRLKELSTNLEEKGHHEYAKLLELFIKQHNSR